MKTCPHCGAEWKPRIAEPLKCPRCWLPLRGKNGKAEESQDAGRAATQVQAEAGAEVGAERGQEKDGRPERKRSSAKSCAACGGLNGMHQKGCEETR